MSQIAWKNLPIARLPRKDDWQPFKTAPKDGTYILVADYGDEQPLLVYWDAATGWTDGDFTPDWAKHFRWDVWMPCPTPPNRPE